MDRKIQLGIALVLIMLGNVFSQCSDSIKIVRFDTCKMVQMNMTTFNTFYKYKKAYETVSKIPIVVDSLENVSRREQKAFSKQLEVLESHRLELKKELFDYEIENSILINKNRLLNKQRFSFLGIGVCAGGVLALLIVK